ncbi:hypothetical protein K435DRAFT_782804 [Dendrothele bispora CBS 962.96]|uniref:Uncharacterized protein n=1 Tax=Dendrothele bispora (strain CBS 962.96) TaxID=1314807 RepID=A0A4S8LD32_DENBC|nr:hypothetical protein K435DRAFT_785439 [Dendrothele bispora CBS 962.96]THU86543.1 hypothetical protein K435DRAFT_782804 [Dendrothele bispora CBS 962.96]
MINDKIVGKIGFYQEGAGENSLGRKVLEVRLTGGNTRRSMIMEGSLGPAAKTFEQYVGRTCEQEGQENFRQDRLH